MKLTPHLAALALLTTSCTSPEPERAAPPTARHLVLVTIDTLRADRLGSYGNLGLPTPNLDRLAAEGTMAPDAMVHVPLTRPSHFSLFSGLLPSQHGIRDNVAPGRGPETPLLAEVLQTAGFRTAAFVSSIVLASHTGLDRGFDTYSDKIERKAGESFFASKLQKRGDETVQEAVSWLESNREARLFAWIHLYDPHEPYDPPEPYASRYAERPYEGEVAWTDELVGRIDAALTRLELRDQTLLCVTSDHGEGMGEHREATHGFFIYQSTLAVPLFFRGPGVMPGGRLSVTVRTIDLLPTLLGLVGVPPPAAATFPGQSLVAALQGQEPPPEPLTYAETLEPRLHYGWSDLRSVREGRWKYIQAPRPELYDLENDPQERRNLAQVEHSRVEALQASLERILAAEPMASTPGEPGVSLPLDLREKLGALGYVGGPGAAGAADPGADPKDKIDDFRIATDLMSRGLVRLQEGDFAGSVKLFRDLLGRGVRSFELHFYLARALLAQKQHREAAAQFEQAVGFEPGYPAGWGDLANCRVALGDLRGAVEAIRSGQESSPRDAGLRRSEARLWRRLGESEQARRAYESALPLAPDDALLRAQLGELLRDMGEVVEAIRRLREAVELDPEPASYWNSLGMVLGAHERLAEAEKAFRQAWERDDSNAQYAFNTGLALLRLGRPKEARSFFETTLELEPGFEAARLYLAEIGP